MNKKVYIILVIISIMFTIFNNCAVISTSNTNKDIFTVEEIKSIATQFIMDHGYANDDSSILQRNPHLKDLKWGSIILVENISEYSQYNKSLNKLKYYYAVNGVLPDGAIGVSAAFDAKTGAFITSSLYRYTPEQKTFIMNEDEIIPYAKEILNLSPEDKVITKTIFYWDDLSYTRYPHAQWKYQIKVDKKIETRAGYKDTFYIDPVILDKNRYNPSSINLINFATTHRVFVLEHDVNTRLSSEHVDLIGID